MICQKLVKYLMRANALAVALAATIVQSHAQDITTKPLTVSFDFGDRTVQIAFRNCPSGILVSGEPKPVAAESESPAPNNSGALSGIGSSVSMNEFYISETEISTAQFAGVLGDIGYQGFRDYARTKLVGKAAEYLPLIDSPGSFPVFLVTPQQAIQFCTKLQSAETGSQSGISRIEGRQYRIPSHPEWQYACRAQKEEAAAQHYPHFSNWIDYEALPKNDKAKCLEEWTAMGRNENDFKGTQFQVAEIITSRYSNTNPKPLEILSAFLRESLGLRRDYSKLLPGPIVEVGSTKPNLWGLTEMHENAREWTLAISDPGEMQSFWKQLSAGSIAPQDQTRKAFFLAGGSSIDTMDGDKSNWSAFSIWGGRPMDLQSRQPLPFSLEEEKISDLTNEYQPGLRVVMDRVLVDQWLLIVRRSTLPRQNQNDGSSNDLESYRTTVREIVPASKQNEILATIDFYSGLAAYSDGRVADAAQILESSKSKLFGTKKKKINLADLAVLSATPPAVTQPSASAPQESDDQAFVRLLQSVVTDDSASGR